MHLRAVGRDGREASGQVEGLVPQLPDGCRLPELASEERPEREEASRPLSVRAHQGPVPGGLRPHPQGVGPTAPSPGRRAERNRILFGEFDCQGKGLPYGIPGRPTSGDTSCQRTLRTATLILD